jgi:aspartyl-tRNA(Asn)/glutamyl-tRNA(Gln) amidotransferase subunit A
MDLCYGALGTDTGGSIRTPSAHCGVVGLKPTYGRVSIRGIVPLTWSLDHCGPIARTVQDAAMILQQIAGYDKLDVDSEEHPVGNYVGAIGAPVANFRIGIPPRYFDMVELDVQKAVEDAIAVLNKLTKGSHEMNNLPEPLAGQLGAEGVAYHTDLHAPDNLYMSGRGRTGNQESIGNYVRAWRELQLLRRTVDDAFQDIDVVVMPTRRRTAKSIAEELKPRSPNALPPPPDPENTRPFDAYGIPAISVPCGYDHEGMPIGLQIAAAHWNEEKVIALAHAYEQATEWHKRRPPLQPDTKVPTVDR